jgi:NADH-quinone oxidoreductase subunit H
MQEAIASMQGALGGLFGPVWGAHAWTFGKTLAGVVAILVPLLLLVLYYQIIERWVIGWIQVRRGPNRVTFFGIKWLRGWGQPVADAIKLLLKEQIVPAGASKALFLMAPVIAAAPALGVWALVPFSPELVLANADAGMLALLAMTSMGVYGIIIAGWASNSKYAFLGSLRATAQVVSYEIAMGFAIVGALMAGQSMNLIAIVQRQQTDWGLLGWFALPLFPLFIVHFIAGLAETNRAPFDMAEGESEIVAGFHVEYSGIAFALFFMAEYANMILVGVVSAILFLGGWLSPFDFAFLRASPATAWITVAGFHWFAFKIAFMMFLFLWIRASFPRFRYDQVMRLGWKIFIPVTLVWIVVVGVMMMEPFRGWLPFSLWFGR